jgi:hypothetical protein
MSADTVSRASLAIVGGALGLRQSVLSATGSATRNNVAETFEAILGAIYVDSNYSVQAIKDVIKRVRLDDHKFLKTREQELETNGDVVVPEIGGSSGFPDHLPSHLNYRREFAVRDSTKTSPSAVSTRKKRNQARLERGTVKISYIPQQDLAAKFGTDTLDSGREKIHDGANKDRPGPIEKALSTKTETLSPWVEAEMVGLERTRDNNPDPEKVEAATKAREEFYRLLREGVEESPHLLYRNNRRAMARALELKMVVKKKKLEEEGVPPLVAQQVAWKVLRSETQTLAEEPIAQQETKAGQEGTKAKKLHEATAEQPQKGMAAAEQAFQQETKEEETRVEPKTSTTSTRSSEGSSGAQSQKESPPPASSYTSLIQDMQKDKASDVELDRKTLWKPMVQRQTPQNLAPLTSALEQPSNAVHGIDTGLKEEVQDPSITPTLETTTRHTMEGRDGSATITKDADITKLNMEAWPIQKSKVRSVSQATREPTVSYTPKSKMPETQRAKADGVEPIMYTSEMGPPIAGLMNDEWASLIEMKQNKGKPEDAVEPNGVNAQISVSRMLILLVENMNDSTSSIAQMPYIKPKLMVRAKRRTRADSEIAQLSFQTHELLNGIRRRSETVARSERNKKTYGERSRKARPRSIRAKFEDVLREVESKNVQLSKSPVSTEPAESLANPMDMQQETPEKTWFSMNPKGYSLTTKEVEKSVAWEEQEKSFVAQLTGLEVESDESNNASHVASSPVKPLVDSEEEPYLPPVPEPESEAIPSTTTANAPIEYLPLSEEGAPVPATSKRARPTWYQKSEGIPNTTPSPEPSQIPEDEVSVLATLESAPFALHEESEVTHFTAMPSKVVHNVAKIVAQVIDDTTAAALESQRRATSPSTEVLDSMREGSQRLEAQGATPYPVTSTLHSEPEPVAPLPVGPHLSRIAEALRAKRQENRG